MDNEQTAIEKKKKLYFILTVAEIVLGIVGIAVFVVLSRTEEDIKTYIVALLLALVMIVSGTHSLFKLLKMKKEAQAATPAPKTDKATNTDEDK